MIRPRDLSNLVYTAYRFKHITSLMFWDAHVKSVKHMGLVRFDHFLDPYIYFVTSSCWAVCLQLNNIQFIKVCCY